MTPAPETERLRFRQFTEGDVEGYYEFFADPVTQMIYPLMNRGLVWREIAKILGHWKIRGFGQWALEDKASGRFVGFTGLWFPGDFDDVEVGYGLHPAFRGRGYALEAARRALDYGYSEHNFQRIVSYIQPINQLSIRVAEKLGAKPAGIFNLLGKAHTIYLHQTPNLKVA
jgi:ribosomal-protein-alanine N-acetyltransferase